MVSIISGGLWAPWQGGTYHCWGCRVMGCGRSDGDAYLSFLSLIVLELEVRVLVAAAINDDVVAVTVTKAGVWLCVVVDAQLLGAVMVVNGKVCKTVVRTWWWPSSLWSSCSISPCLARSLAPPIFSVPNSPENADPFGTAQRTFNFTHLSI